MTKGVGGASTFLSPKFLVEYTKEQNFLISCQRGKDCKMCSLHWISQLMSIGLIDILNQIDQFENKYILLLNWTLSDGIFHRYGFFSYFIFYEK